MAELIENNGWMKGDNNQMGREKRILDERRSG